MIATPDQLIQQPPRHFGDQDTRIAYRIIGSGPALLMIHGFPLHGLTYRKIVPKLSRHYTCVAVDLPGAGESTWNRATDFSFLAHARRLKSLMNEIGHDRYAVLGHDTGGSVARHLALVAAGQVRKLVLINTEIPDRRPPWIPFYQKLLKIPGSTYTLQGLFRLPAFRHSGAAFGGCFVDESLIDGEFHDLFVKPLIQEHRRALGYARFIRGMDWAENDAFSTLHGRIRCPVGFIWGRLDPTFPYEHALGMAAQFPNVLGFEVIDNARLLPHEEQPEDVSAALRGFLEH